MYNKNMNNNNTGQITQNKPDIKSEYEPNVYRII